MIVFGGYITTRASAVIPGVALYVALLYRVMKEKGIHEGCIEQARRLFENHLSRAKSAADSEGRIRLDDREMRPDVQQEVERRWREATPENLRRLADIEGAQDDFYRFFGFRLPPSTTAGIFRSG